MLSTLYLDDLKLLVSVIAAFSVFVYLVVLLWRFFSFNRMPDFKKCGEWAVITGCTDGIGKGFAHNLARCGLNIVLLSRSITKLKQVAQEIELTYNVKTKIIHVDFTNSDIYEQIEKELKDLDIGVLVNNVGMSYKYPEYFGDISGGRKFCMDLLNCNITSVTMMTQIVLQSMVAKRKGVIINISSISGAFPCPLLSLYGASKAFVKNFSLSLQSEYKKMGIVVHTVIPGYVATAMSGIRKPSFTVPSPQSFATTTLKRVFWQHCTGGCWVHDIQLLGVTIMSNVAPFIKDYIILKMLGEARKRALRKHKQDSAKND